MYVFFFFFFIFLIDENSTSRSEKFEIDEPLIKIMKYTYKLNSRRNLALKKRDVYGISSNDFIVIKCLSKCLLYTAALKKHLRKIDVLTDVKHNQIKKVMERIIDGIDEQLRINRSAIISERGRKHGGHYTFDDFNSHNFSGLFRFRSPTDLQRLHDGFGLPEKMRIHTYRTTDQEVLMISLVRLAYPHRWEDVERIFPGVKRWKLQKYFYWFLDFIIQNWSYLILNNRNYWVPPMGNMATAINNKLASLPNEDYRLHFPDDLPFTVFSFIDNTMTAMCRPGGGPITGGIQAPRVDKLVQQAWWTGWKKLHGLKMQTVFMPNGMDFEVWGPVSVRHNDNYTLANSSILEKLEQCQLGNPIKYVTFRDSPYGDDDRHALKITNQPLM